MPQKFAKNDTDENKFIAVWEAMLQGTFDDLTEYFENAYKSPELATHCGTLTLRMFGIFYKNLSL